MRRFQTLETLVGDFRLNRVKYFAIALLLLAVPHSSFAEESDEQITLPVPRSVPRRFEFSPRLSVVSITSLGLPSSGYQIDYKGKNEGLPAIQLVLTRPLGEWRGLTAALEASVGYGSRTGNYDVLFQETPTANTTEKVTLHWLPFSFASKVEYRHATFPYVRPSLSLGIGSLGLLQRSQNKALNESYGIPFVMFSPRLNFMDSTNVHWLGGFSFGATILQSVSPTQALRATSLDLSIQILM